MDTDAGANAVEDLKDLKITGFSFIFFQFYMIDFYFC